MSTGPAVSLKAGFSEQFWEHSREGMEMGLDSPQTGAEDWTGLPALSKHSKDSEEIN